jgi:hypothetical protein
MILLVHLLFGALIGQKISNPLLAIILAFLGHYFLDFIPHIEYPNNVSQGIRRRDIVKVLADFISGILLIMLFSENRPIIYVSALFAILPDIIYASKFFWSNRLIRTHERFHDKIHFLGNKKIPMFLRIFSQVIVVILCLILLRI